MNQPSSHSAGHLANTRTLTEVIDAIGATQFPDAWRTWPKHQRARQRWQADLATWEEQRTRSPLNIPPESTEGRMEIEVLRRWDDLRRALKIEVFFGSDGTEVVAEKDVSRMLEWVENRSQAGETPLDASVAFLKTEKQARRRPTKEQFYAAVAEPFPEVAVWSDRKKLELWRRATNDCYPELGRGGRPRSSDH